MNENLDLTKILKGCPKGTKLYSSIYGDVLFLGITAFNQIKVRRANNDDVQFYCSKKGKIYEYEEAECILFPSKCQRDWSKFERFWDKPKVERFDPNTLQPFDRVLSRNEIYEPWRCEFFSNMITKFIYPVICAGRSWRYCIPYNDETKHLVGTTEDCPEYYKWWKNLED